MAGISHWWTIAAVIEVLAVVAWILTLRTRQVRFTFVVGFNAILPVTLLHLCQGPIHWRSALALAMVVIYLVRMNWVILGWTRHTAMEKLDRNLSISEKHVLPFVMTNAAGWLYCLPFYFVSQRVAPFRWTDVLAIVIYVAGSILHTTADLHKKRFKEHAENKDRILDRGPWAWSRHPNYFGDFLIYVSWAILAANPWAWASPATNLLQYAFDAIPKSETWAKQHYGAMWDAYRRRTSCFVPLPPRS